MQVSFQEELQKQIEITKQLITKDDIKFVKENYQIDGNGNYILFTYKIKQLPKTIQNKVSSLKKRKIGYYSSLSGHTIPFYLID